MSGSPPAKERQDGATASAPTGFLTESSLLALAVIWGVNFSVIKVALEELDPFVFNALRFPLAAAVLLGLLRLTRGRRWIDMPDRDDRVRLVVLGLVGNVLYQVLFIVGVDRTTAGNASLLLATTPVWTLMLSVLMGHERPPAMVWVGVTGTLGGMVLVVLGGAGVALGSDHLAGDLLMVGASMTWSVYTVGSRDLVMRYGALPVTAWTLWAAVPGLVLLGLPGLLTLEAGTVSGKAWIAVVYAGVLAISVAYVIWYRGVRHLGNARTAVYSNLVPVAALAVAWLWLGEVPTPLQGAGALVVLAGLTLTRTARRPGRPGKRQATLNPRD